MLKNKIKKKPNFGDEYIDSNSIIYQNIYKCFPNQLVINPEFDEKLLNYIVEKYSVDLNTAIKSESYCSIQKKRIYEHFVIELPNKVLFSYNKHPYKMFSKSLFLLYSCEAGEKIVNEIFDYYYESKIKNYDVLHLLNIEHDSYIFEEFEKQKMPYDLNMDLNYNDDLLESDKIITEAINNNVNGLILLHGLPGTGKTSYIRDIIQRTKRLVLYVSPDMAFHIGNPEFLNALKKYKGAILIIEDAESVLQSRQINDSLAVSTLLNLTDGILSDVLRLTIICTFNSKLELIDEALLRKGRIIVRYEFKKLFADKVKKITGEDLGDLTLAEVYNLNKKDYSMIINKSKIGFKQ